MRARIRKPSPAMVVAIVALVMATTGSAAALTVSFALNAGQVDGRDAYPPTQSAARTAGKLVATSSAGPLAGTIPYFYLDRRILNPDRTRTFSSFTPVNDNGGRDSGLLDIPGLLNISVNCKDTNATANVEDPALTFTVSNRTGGAANLARQGGPLPTQSVTPIAKGDSVQFTAPGANAFALTFQAGTRSVTIQAGTIGYGTGSGNASCLSFGQSIQVG